MSLVIAKRALEGKEARWRIAGARGRWRLLHQPHLAFNPSSGVDSGKLADDSSVKWVGSALLAELWIKGDGAWDTESVQYEGLPLASASSEWVVSRMRPDSTKSTTETSQAFGRPFPPECHTQLV